MQLPQISKGRRVIAHFVMGNETMALKISVRLRRSEAQLREQGQGAAPDRERDGVAGPGVLAPHATGSFNSISEASAGIDPHY